MGGGNTASKALIALGILGAAGVGIYLLTRGKKGADQIAQAEKGVREALQEGSEEISGKAPKILDDGIQPYANQEIVKKLQTLNGPNEKVLQDAKKIFLEELGYSPDLIKLEISDKMQTAGLFNCESTIGGFNYYTGALCLNKEVIKEMPSAQLISLLRHELDHFDKATKICKSIGVEKYQELFAGMPEQAYKDYDGAKLVFNSDFWQKVSKEAKTDGFESEKYVKALHDYIRGPQPDGSLYSTYLGKYKYITNPMEQSAYSVEHSLEKSLNFEIKNLQTYDYLVKDFERADKALQELIQRQPELEKYKSSIFDYLFSKSVIQADEELSKMYTQILKGDKNQELIAKFQQKLQQKYSSIQGSFLGKDTIFELKVLQKIPEVAKEALKPSAVVEALNNHETQLYSSMQNIMIDGESKVLIKPKFLEINKNLLEYLEKNKIDEPALELQLLFKQIVVEKDINPLGMMFGTKLEDLNISNEVLQKIYSNTLMKKVIDKNPQYTKEQILLSQIQKFLRPQ